MSTQESHHHSIDYDQQKKREEIENIFKDYTPFYGGFGRDLQITPPNRKPIYDIWGEEISPDLYFFKFPKKIGKLVVGASNSTIDNLESQKQQIIKNLYIGINGFAFFKKDKNDRLIENIEVNFNDITDVSESQKDHYKKILGYKISYRYTKFSFKILNRETGKIVNKREGIFNKKQDLNLQGSTLNVCRALVKYWTFYLLDTMKEQMKENGGYISFNIIPKNFPDSLLLEYLRLGTNSITYLNPNGKETIYQLKDLKYISCDKNNLYLRTSTSNQEITIPIAQLYNLDFFHKALTILYKNKFISRIKKFSLKGTLTNMFS